MKYYNIILILLFSITLNSQCDDCYCDDIIGVTLPATQTVTLCQANVDLNGVICSVLSSTCMLDLDDYFLNSIDYGGTWSTTSDVILNGNNAFNIKQYTGTKTFTYTVECFNCTWSETYTVIIQDIMDNALLTYCDNEDLSINLNSEFAVPSGYGVTQNMACSVQSTSYTSFNPSTVPPGLYTWNATYLPLNNNDPCMGICQAYLQVEVLASPVINLPSEIYVCKLTSCGIDLDNYLLPGSDASGTWSFNPDCDGNTSSFGDCPFFGSISAPSTLFWNPQAYTTDCYNDLYYTVSNADCTSCERVDYYEVPAPSDNVVNTNQFCQTPGSAYVLGAIGSGAVYEVDVLSDYIVTGISNPFDPSTLPLGITTFDIERITYNGVPLSYSCDQCKVTGNVEILNCCSGISITSTATIVDEVCSNGQGSIDQTVGGNGTGPYTFSWSNGAITEDIVSLSSGTYTVTIEDSNGCQGIYSYTVNNDPGNINISTTIQDITCTNPIPSVTFHSGSGISFPLIISISHSTTSSCNPSNQVVSTLPHSIVLNCEGNYTFQIVDSNNCTYNGSFTIDDLSNCCNPIVITETIVDETCSQSNGSITLSVTGGTPIYSYNWSPNVSMTNVATMLSAGTYNVTVTDQDGCTEAETYIVNDDLSSCCNPEIAFTGSSLSLARASCNFALNIQIEASCNSCCPSGTITSEVSTDYFKNGNFILAIPTPPLTTTDCSTKGANYFTNAIEVCDFEAGDVLTATTNYSNISNTGSCALIVNNTSSTISYTITQADLDACNCNPCSDLSIPFTDMNGSSSSHVAAYLTSIIIEKCDGTFGYLWSTIFDPYTQEAYFFVNSTGCSDQDIATEINHTAVSESLMLSHANTSLSTICPGATLTTSGTGVNTILTLSGHSGCADALYIDGTFYGFVDPLTCEPSSGTNGGSPSVSDPNCCP